MVVQATRNDSKTWIVTIVPSTRSVGRIYLKEGGFQYIPKGQKEGGEMFPTLQACIKSLED